MKPLARLYLNRQRTYERSCTDSGEATEEEDGNPLTLWNILSSKRIVFSFFL